MKKVLITIGILVLAAAGYFAYNYFAADNLGAQQKTAEVSAIYLHGDSNGTTTETNLFKWG